jgi:archaellum component FlaC
MTEIEELNEKIKKLANKVSILKQYFKILISVNMGVVSTIIIYLIHQNA